MEPSILSGDMRKKWSMLSQCIHLHYFFILLIVVFQENSDYLITFAIGSLISLQNGLGPDPLPAKEVKHYFYLLYVWEDFHMLNYP